MTILLWEWTEGGIYLQDQGNRELVVQRFMQSEEGIQHPTYDSELQFYEMVSDGRVQELQKITTYGDVDMESRGMLSFHALRNFRYHIIVTVVMISRFCIEKGMDERDSYGLSDYYIRRLDETETAAELKRLHRELIFDYAERMRKLSVNENYSIHCVRAMDYVQNHLHETIRLSDIANYVNLERTYLCRLFCRETGWGLNDYIRRERVKVAKNMLEDSEYSCTEIAGYLAFSSDSYFGKVFRNEVGMTPSEYRRACYRKHWVKK